MQFFVLEFQTEYLWCFTVETLGLQRNQLFHTKISLEIVVWEWLINIRISESENGTVTKVFSTSMNLVIRARVW
jgi:hypothetical protein